MGDGGGVEDVETENDTFFKDFLCIIVVSSIYRERDNSSVDDETYLIALYD